MSVLLHRHKDQLAHLAGCHLASLWKSQDPCQVGPAAAVVKGRPDDADNVVCSDVLRRGNERNIKLPLHQHTHPAKKPLLLIQS